jgi:hypothetical protein
VVIATEGKRRELWRAVKSATVQSWACDEIIVVGPINELLALIMTELAATRPFTQSLIKHVCVAPGNDWGHTERNVGMSYARGTHIMFLDDDDAYLPKAFDTVRKYLEVRPRSIHMFRMIDLNGALIWGTPEFKQGNVGTPMIVVPNLPERLGRWGTRYEGDFDFMESTRKLSDEPVIWVPIPIVGCRSYGGLW